MTTYTYNRAPGSILQQMYLKSRLKKHLHSSLPKTFIEVGCGSGNISAIFLELGFSGMGFDLNEEACTINKEKNASFIAAGKYQVLNSDFFASEERNVGIILSSHVLEHLPEPLLKNFFHKCKEMLAPGGIIISIVPACMEYWAIEDDTVGHYRRFEYVDFSQISAEFDFKILDISGLTYPMSNTLFRISNRLVTKAEEWKLELDKEEQTKLSSSGGARQVKFKDVYPWWVKYFVNEITMIPFYALQRLFRRAKKAMVIYCELQSR